MGPSAWLGTRRALLIYLCAVVGPTLAVLVAGTVAVRRQRLALEALQVTTRAIQEERIVEEAERLAIEQAGAALRDARLAAVAALPVDAPPEDMDRARDGLPSYHLAHPIVRHVVVLEARQVVYPRVDPPLPVLPGGWLHDEPPRGRARLAQQVAQAQAEERSGTWATAASRYGEAARMAMTTRVKAWLVAAAARCAAAGGDRPRAIGAYRQLTEGYATAYTPAGRPYPVAAAIELRRLQALDAATQRRIADAVVSGAWSMAAGQVRYALGELGRPIAATRDGVLGYLHRAALVRDELQPVGALPPGDVRLQSVSRAGESFDVASTGLPQSPARMMVVVLDDRWIHGTLVPTVAARLAPGVHVRVNRVPRAGHGFRTMQPGWRVSIDAPAASPRWLRRELVTFAAAVSAVLGVLVMGVVLLMRDVRRETALNEMREDLVSGVSHELKAPVSVIRVYAETLETADDATLGQRREFAHAIVEEADRLQRLVDDVVDFSRIQQGQRVYRLQPGSLTAAVSRAVERFRRYADLHAFRVTADLGHAGNPMPLDGAAVEQAVLNLLDNAVKYGGDAKRVDVRLRYEKDEALVEVRDEGPGIPAGAQARIFDRFHRGPHGDRGGYGLGLYLVRHVMEAHGGTVTVDSEAGRGSLFRLRFPREDADHAQDSAG